MEGERRAYIGHLSLSLSQSLLYNNALDFIEILISLKLKESLLIKFSLNNVTDEQDKIKSSSTIRRGITRVSHTEIWILPSYQVPLSTGCRQNTGLGIEIVRSAL